MVLLKQPSSSRYFNYVVKRQNNRPDVLKSIRTRHKKLWNYQKEEITEMIIGLLDSPQVIFPEEYLVFVNFHFLPILIHKSIFTKVLHQFFGSHYYFQLPYTNLILLIHNLAVRLHLLPGGCAASILQYRQFNDRIVFQKSTNPVFNQFCWISPVNE